MDLSIQQFLDKGLLPEPSDKTAFETFRHALTGYVDELIQYRFDELIRLLYRVDVDEIMLRKILAHLPGQPSAEVIADLLIERQWQKVKSRQEFKRDEDIPDDERW